MSNLFHHASVPFILTMEEPHLEGAQRSDLSTHEDGKRMSFSNFGPIEISQICELIHFKNFVDSLDRRKRFLRLIGKSWPESVFTEWQNLFEQTIRILRARSRSAYLTLLILGVLQFCLENFRRCSSPLLVQISLPWIQGTTGS